MCTAVILHRPGHVWPLIFGANRDEMRDRPWRAPGRHWPERPQVVAGLDILSGGAWLGVNDEGVLAAVLNQPDSLGPAAGKRSRGELVLEALDHAEAREAAKALADIDPAAYRGFHVIVADPRHALWLRHPGTETGEVCIQPIPEGVSMLTAQDLNDAETSPRIAYHLPRFRAAVPPDPGRGGWSAWERALASREKSAGAPRDAAMSYELENGFGTVAATLVALPAYPARPDAEPRRPVMRFAAGRPDRAEFYSVSV